MIKVFKITTLLIAFGFLLSGCAPKQSQRKKSYPDDKISQTESLTQPTSHPEVKAQAIQLEKLLEATEPIVMNQIDIENERFGVGLLMEEEFDAGLLMEKVIAPLMGVIFNIDYLSVEENRYARTKSGRYIMGRLVNLFNEAILLVNKHHPLLIQNSKIMEKYKEVLFWDCNQDLKGSCVFINFFRAHDSVNMSRIIKIMHDKEVDEDEKLRLIKAGFELKNRRLDPSLIFMLLERISISFFQENEGQMNPRRRKQDIDLFSNTLKIATFRKFDQDEKYLEIIRLLKPWTLSRSIDDTRNPSMTNIVDLFSRHLLYNKNGILSDEMKNDVIPSLLYTVKENYEQGFYFQESNIRGEFSNIKKEEFKERYKEYLKSKKENSELKFNEQMLFSQIDQAPSDVYLYGPESKDILNTLLGRTSLRFS